MNNVTMGLIDEPFYIYSNRRKRIAYDDVQYERQEQELIAKFKSSNYGQSLKSLKPFSDSVIIRYLYSTNFDEKETYTKLLQLNEWDSNKKFQLMTENALNIINEGCIYLYGRDKAARPIMFFNLQLINLGLYQLNDYLCALKQVLKVIQAMFIRGKQQTFCIVIDFGGRAFTSLNLEATKSIVDKMSAVYSMRLGKMLLINTNALIKFAFKTIKSFIAEETQQKIALLSVDEVKERKILEWIGADQLEFKYGGSRPNSFTYWPPKRPGQNAGKKNNIARQEGSQYYSLASSNAFWATQSTPINHVYCCVQQCRIF